MGEPSWKSHLYDALNKRNRIETENFNLIIDSCPPLSLNAGGVCFTISLV
jgi:hypothetical protein